MYKRKQALDAHGGGDDDEEERRAPASKKTKGKTATTAPRAVMYTNKQRVLILSSRGITARYRHLLEDLKNLIPHHKKDNKLDTKRDLKVVNEIAEMKSCNQIIYLDTRKHTDLYMYLGQTPNGPSVKFHVVNVHTMDELKLTGNCMMGSRPLLNFDSQFNDKEHWQLIKGLLTDVFGCPRFALLLLTYRCDPRLLTATLHLPLPHLRSPPPSPEATPKANHSLTESCPSSSSKTAYVSLCSVASHAPSTLSAHPPLPACTGVRNYQILDKSDREDGKSTHLVEIGPRMVLMPIRIFSGSLGGATLYQNPTFVSPNEERSQFKKRKGDRFTERVQRTANKKQMDAAMKLPPDELSNASVFR